MLRYKVVVRGCVSNRWSHTNSVSVGDNDITLVIAPYSDKMYTKTIQRKLPPEDNTIHNTLKTILAECWLDTSNKHSVSLDIYMKIDKDPELFSFNPNLCSCDIVHVEKREDG